MDRLTCIDSTGQVATAIKGKTRGDRYGTQDCLIKLKRYEDTGLEPEEIIGLTKAKEYWEREAKKNAAELGEIKIREVNEGKSGFTDFIRNRFEKLVYGWRNDYE